MLLPIVLTLFPLLVSFVLAKPPGPRYERLAKPSWTPPPVVFPVVWTVLYLLMGYASARVATTIGLWTVPIAAYAVQLLLNVSWTPVFFGRGDYAAALTILRGLLVAVVWTTIAFWRVDPASGALLLPYIAWLLVAHELNRGVVDLNPQSVPSAAT